MNELTKREQIALACLGWSNFQMKFNEKFIETATGKACIHDGGAKQYNSENIIDAFTFADLFLSISEDKAGKTVSEMENLESRR